MAAPLHIGALVYDYQAMDVVGPFDLLNSATKSTMNVVQSFYPVDEKTIAQAPEFIFHHIGETLNPGPLLTSSFTIMPNTTVDTCPELDILLLGGPNIVGGPSQKPFELSPTYIEFVRRHVAAGKLVFTTCTGASVLASTGVLDGKSATVNNQEWDWVIKKYPQVKWTKAEKWVVDGNLWTGSGAIAGMDMVAHWIKENYGLDVLMVGASVLDYEPRDIDGMYYKVLPKRYDENGKHVSTHLFV